MIVYQIMKNGQNENFTPTTSDYSANCIYPQMVLVIFG